MKVVNTARNFNIDGCNAIKMMQDAGLEVLDYGDYVFKSDEERLKIVEDADVIIPAVEEMQADFLARCKKLKLISLRGIGYDNIDAEYCKQNGIELLRARGSLEGSVAEQVIAYIMHFARQITLQNEYMQNGEWHRIMTDGASGKVLGLVGFGAIGKEIARRANALGMDVKYFCRHPQDKWAEEYDAEYMPLDELLAISDYVSINTPLTNETRGMFDAGTIARMKQGAVLINIARGAIVDTIALKSALDNGQLSGCAIDVYNEEPCTDSILIGVKNAILTPHTSPYTKSTFIKMNELTAQNVLDFINNEIKDEYRIK